MAGHEKEERKRHEKKQASVLITLTGIIVFGGVESVSLYTGRPLPLYVLCIFAGIVIPPELVKRVLRAFLGGHDDE